MKFKKGAKVIFFIGIVFMLIFSIEYFETILIINSFENDLFKDDKTTVVSISEYDKLSYINDYCYLRVDNLASHQLEIEILSESNCDKRIFLTSGNHINKDNTAIVGENIKTKTLNNNEVINIDGNNYQVVGKIGYLSPGIAEDAIIYKSNNTNSIKPVGNVYLNQNDAKRSFIDFDKFQSASNAFSVNNFLSVIKILTLIMVCIISIVGSITYLENNKMKYKIYDQLGAFNKYLITKDLAKIFLLYSIFSLLVKFALFKLVYNNYSFNYLMLIGLSLVLFCSSYLIMLNKFKRLRSNHNEI